MVTINLQDDIAAALESRAQQQGLSLEGFLASVVKEPCCKNGAKPQDRNAIGEFIAAIDVEADNGPAPASTFTRAEIYGDHP